MKRNGIWILLLIIGLTSFVFGTVAWAAGEKEVTVIGVLEKEKRKVFLTTANDKFMVTGQDFSALIGKKVKATGTVRENYRGKSLLVTVMEIVRE